MINSVELIHITHKEYALQIIEQGFNVSRQTGNVSGQKYPIVQWLGDGVYFFEYNNKRAEKLGERIVSRKKEFNKERPFIYSDIRVNINLNDLIYKDFLNEEDFKELYDFINQVIQEQVALNGFESLVLLNKFDTLLEALRNKEPFDNEKGSFLGYFINQFVNTYPSEIDIISMSFYMTLDEDRGRKTSIYGLIELEPICQYCIKNIGIIPKEILKLCLE